MEKGLVFVFFSRMGKRVGQSLPSKKCLPQGGTRDLEAKANIWGFLSAGPDRVHDSAAVGTGLSF